MGGDREESKHKHKRHKKHSSSKKHSHKHKSDHKHQSSRHHRHGRSHKKHHKHKDKKKVDEATLQNALENLEALEDILKTSGGYSPEELMLQVLKDAEAGSVLVGDTYDSSSDSDADTEENPESRVVNQPTTSADDGVKLVGEVASINGTGSSTTGKGSSVTSENEEKGPTASLELETLPPGGVMIVEGEVEKVVKSEKLVSEPNKDDNKPPSSLAEQDSDSSSNSEAAGKLNKGSGRKGGVFKQFSKKLKSKPEIKINIRQTKAESTTAEQSETEVEKDEKSSNIKSESRKDKSKSKASNKKERDGESKKSRRSRTRSRSHSRSRSQTRHKRERSKTPKRRRSRSRSGSRSRWSRRRRSHSRSRRRRSRSRSHFRTRRYRSRSRSYSRSRRHRSRSRSRSYSRRHRKRSRSRSHSRRHRTKSRSHSRSRRHRSRSRSGSQSPTRVKNKTNDADKSGEVSAAPGENTGNKIKVISKLTAFCKDLQEKQAHEDVYGETQAVDDSEIHHPFAVKPTQPTYVQQPTLVYHNNAWKTSNQLAIEADAAKPLVEKFPVSAGIQHTRENPAGSDNVFDQYKELSKMSMADLVAQRLQVQRQILINPADIVAHQALNQIEQQTALWAESKVTPGQYTGQQKITPLSREAHNTGYQAWAKKKMFRGLAPVGDGFGRKLMKKMGWKEGQAIGKQGEGHVEPICVDVKLDRCGLTTEGDWKSKGGGVQPASVLKGTKADAKAFNQVEGKHPVSALQEFCARKKWDPPHYELKENIGPAHLKTFVYEVTTPLGTFYPAVGSNTKKLAKMQAATAALQGLGLIEKTIEYKSV